jgi:hypothetical protein
MSMRGTEVDVGLRLLDHQLIDSEEIRCGKIDDIQFETIEGQLVVAALLSGPRAQRRRLPNWAARFAQWFGRDVEHRVEWSHVDKIDAPIRLDCPGGEVGLGEGDRNAKDLISERVPKS